MGMKQRRCPSCKKSRRYIEGRQRSFNGRDDGWLFDGEKMVCKQCAAKLEQVPLDIDEDNCYYDGADMVKETVFTDSIIKTVE
jgi:hypothetical protein